VQEQLSQPWGTLIFMFVVSVFALVCALKHASPKAADDCYGIRDARDNWKALELYQEAYQQIFNRTHDEHNLALADICERMATCYVMMDKKGIALDWLTRAVSIRELCQGTNALRSVRSRCSLFGALIKRVLRICESPALGFCKNTCALIPSILFHDVAGKSHVDLAHTLVRISAVLRYVLARWELQRREGWFGSSHAAASAWT
jgi:hypothetical protein